MEPLILIVVLSFFGFIASIVVANSSLSYKIKFIPHYLKRKYAIMMHVINIALIAIMVMGFRIFGIVILNYTLLLLALAFVTLLLSAKIVTFIANQDGESPEETIEEERERK